MRNAAVKFALGSLAVTIAWILFEHLMGYNTTRHDIGQYTRLVPVIFFWIMIVVAIYYTRRGYGNSLTFREGFRTGLIMTLIYCAGFAIVIMLYQQFLNPNYLQTLKDFTLEQMRSEDATQEAIDEKMKELDFTYSGSALSYLLVFVFTSIWGIGITAIASLLLMKKQRQA